MNQLLTTDTVPNRSPKPEVPIYDTAQQRSPILDEIIGIWRYRHLVLQWVRRDIISRYKRSVLGIAWTMLNPLGTTLILAIVFSKVFGSTIQGYAGYVLTGLIPWLFFSQSSSIAVTSLIWGGSLLKSIYIPRTTFAVSAIVTGLVNLLISIVPLFLVMILFGSPLTWTVIFLPVPMLFLAMFSLGIGLLVSSFAIYFYDIVDLYSLLLTAWMYLSPVIYKEELLPPEVHWIVRVNPMYYLINLFRAPLYEAHIPTMEEILVSGGIALITLVVGWSLFSYRAEDFTYRV